MPHHFVIILVHGITVPEIDCSEPSKPSQAYEFFRSAFDSSETPCHVHEFQYPGKSLHENPGYRDTRARAKHVLDYLARQNCTECATNAPLFFIGHDLGGLLIKQLLLIATEVPKYHEIVLRTHGLFFLGTPHRVESNASWERQLLRILSIAELGSRNFFEVAQSLSNVLGKLITESSFVLRNFDVFNCYEKFAGSDTARPTVLEDIAGLDLPKESNVGVNCSHKELWRFGSDDDKTELICQRLRTAVIRANRPSQNSLIGAQSPMLRFIGALSSFNTGTHRLRLTEDEPQFVNWITGHPSYKDWKEKERPIILHLRGAPGSGTTMTARHILRSLWRSRRAANAIVASFSFNKQDSEARTTSSLLISLCRQILLARPNLFPCIMSLCEFLLSQKVFTERTFWSVLHSLILHLSDTAFYCVIHSIHDCESSDDRIDRILRDLSDVARDGSGNIKLLITSNEFYSFTPTTAGILQEIRFDENRQIDAAIENTVRENLKSLPHEIPISADLEDTIVQIITRNKNYLLATCKLDIFNFWTTCSTERAMRQTLHKLPKSLGDSYNYLIGDNHPDWLKTALVSITYASRPLSTAELSVIVALDKYDGTKLSTLRENLSNNISGDLIRSAGSFLKVVDGRIFPLHKSMWNFLLEKTAKWKENPHAFLLDKCLCYLSLCKRLDANVSSEVERNVLESFSHYATVHWPGHFTGIIGKKAKERASKDVYNLLGDNTSAEAWAEDYNRYVGPIGMPSTALDRLLKVVCYFGLTGKLLTKSINQAKSDPDFESVAKQAFDLAAGKGHRQTVSILHGEKIFSRDALGRAAAGGHLRLIKELKTMETFGSFDPSFPDAEGYTPLHHASCAGREAVFQFLLSYWKANSPAQSRGRGRNGERGREESLIKRNIEKRTRRHEYTPLHLATRTGQLAIIHRLVDAGVDTAAEDYKGRNALHLAAQAGFTRIVEFLIQRGKIKPEKTDKKRNTALHLAVEFGHPLTVKSLLKSSRNCHTFNDANATPVHLAAKKGYIGILRLLLNEATNLGMNRNHGGKGNSDESRVGQSGQDQFEMVNAKINGEEPFMLCLNGNHVYTPLQVAAKNGHTDIVNFLFNCDFVSGDHGDRDRGIAVFLAAKHGHFNITKIILKRGVKTSVTDESGNTPLHIAAQAGHYSVIETLVKYCKTYGIDDINHDGWTPLHKAAYQGSLRLVKFLVEKGARIDRLTHDVSKTPLKIAARQGHPKVTGYLFEEEYRKHTRSLKLSLRVKVTRAATIQNGRDAFDIAVVNGHPSVAEALIRGGLELEQPRQLKSLVKYATVLKAMPKRWKASASYGKGSQLSTPLHLAVRKGYASSVEHLLGSVDDIHSRDGRGRTPLQLTALRDNPKICKIILSHCMNHNAWPPDKQEGSTVSINSEHSATTTDEESSDDGEPISRDGETIWVSTTATPLFLACFYTKENAVRAILDWFKDKKGFDIQRHLELDELDEETGWTPLHAAADDANITAMLLGAGANPNCQTANTKSTPLAMAAYGCLEVVKLLLSQAKCHRDPQDSDGETPVHRAVVGESLAILEELASKNAKLDIPRKDGCTPLHLAAATAKTEIFKCLVESGARLDTRSKKYGTLLTAAVLGERLEVVQTLLGKGVDVNATGGPHHTPLQAAARRGNLAIIQKLLEHHAQINIPGDPRQTPLLAAIDSNKEAAALLLWEKGANIDIKDDRGNSLLQLMAKIGSGKMIDILLHEKPDIDLDYQDGNMDTPLCTAISYGHEEIALKLLQAGAKVDSQSKHGHSPLYLAVSKFQNTMVSKLVEKRAYDPAALEHAITQGYDDIVKLIRGKVDNLDPHLDAPGGESWLWLAVRSGRVGVLNALVEDTDLSFWKDPPSGEDLYSRDANVKSCLLCAVSLQKVDMVEALLERQYAHVGERDSSNRTALILDVLNGAGCLTALLTDLRKRWDTTEINIRDSEGKTALIHACMRCDKEAVMNLLDFGADPSISDCRRRGPLYWACRRYSEPIFDLIVNKLEEGKNYTEQYGDGLFGAIASNEVSLVQKLIEKKVISPTVQDIDGWTPVDTARRYGLDFIERRLLAAGFSGVNTHTPSDDEQLAWSTEDRQDALAVKNGVDVIVRKTPFQYIAPPLQDLYAVVRGNKPMRPPPGETVCYFEVKIEKNVRPGSWAIGFCEDTAPLGRMIGWSEGSWGYHGDDGAVYKEGACRYLARFGHRKNEVIGCGINFEKKIAFFTRNGKEIGTLFTGVEGKLYPAVSVDINMIGSRISTKFWDTPKEYFVFQGCLTNPKTLKSPEFSMAPLPAPTEQAESDWDSDEIVSSESEADSDEIVLREHDSE